MTVATITRLPQDALDLVDFWKERRGAGGLPHKRSFDPVQMRRWLGDLSVLEVHQGEKRIFIRLHGSFTSENIGQDFSRRYLEDCTPDHARELALQPYEMSIQNNAPTFSVLVPGLLSGVFNRLERLVLPFTKSDDANHVTVDGFMVWVGPTEIDAYSCSSVYGESEPSEFQRACAREAMQLAVIDVDDPDYVLCPLSQSKAPSAAARPVAKLACRR